MTPTPPSPKPLLARFPAEVLAAYERHRTQGDPDAVQEVVIAAVIDYCPGRPNQRPPVGDSTRLIEDLAYDSVSIAELVFFLEDLFDLTISNEDIMQVRTIADLRACVIRKLAPKAPGA